MPERILEPEMKALLINRLLTTNTIDCKDTIINEFTIGNFSRRVDLAFVRDGFSHAFEIKSEADTLVRLEGQVTKYLEYFDKVTIVTAPKHTAKVLSFAPSNVGVWEVSNQSVTIKKRGRRKNITDKARLLELMTASELLACARKASIKVNSHKRQDLENALFKLPSYKLKASALDAVKHRFLKTSTLFFRNIHDGKVSPEDLAYLSPYKKNNVEKSDFDLDCFIQKIQAIEVSQRNMVHCF